MSLSDKINKLCEQALEKEMVGGIVTLKKTADDSAMHCLITEQSELEGTDPLIPFFPGNVANFVKKLTRITPTTDKILVILRPCEMRAVVEMVKLAQIQNQNIIWLTFDCPGTIPRSDVRGEKIPDSHEFFSDAMNSDDKIRTICATCDYVRADTGDIGFLSFEQDAPFIAYTEQGKKFLNELGIEFIEKAVTDGLDKIIARRIENENKLYDKLNKQVKGIDNLVAAFAGCVNCHNCMTNCPICICRECFFESEAMDFAGDMFIELARRKKGLRAPTDLGVFHIGRMSHMTTSCVSCGACEEACPEKIIVGQIFKWVAANVQKVFDYSAGKKWEDELPLKTFCEEELEQVTGIE